MVKQTHVQVKMTVVWCCFNKKGKTLDKMFQDNKRIKEGKCVKTARVVLLSSSDYVLKEVELFSWSTKYSM